MKLEQLSDVTVLRPDPTVKKKNSAPAADSVPAVSGTVETTINYRGQSIPVRVVQWTASESEHPTALCEDTLFADAAGNLYLRRSRWQGTFRKVHRHERVRVWRVGPMRALLWFLSSIGNRFLPSDLKLARDFWASLGQEVRP